MTYEQEKALRNLTCGLLFKLRIIDRNQVYDMLMAIGRCSRIDKIVCREHYA